MLRLTDRQREVWAEIRRLAEARGSPPTIAELARALGMLKDTARRHVQSLVRRGAARYESHVPRSLEALSPEEARVERGNDILVRAITDLAVEVEKALAAETSPASRRAVAAARRAAEIARAFATYDVDKLS